MLAAHPAAAQQLPQPPQVPGIGRVDRRVAVDPRQPPWDAVAKVQTNIGTRCTGALIAPTVVLTAAHCLYNHVTRALLQAVSLHVLIGYSRGQFRWHRLVARYTVGTGFAGGKSGPQGSDWALLELDGAIPDQVAPLPLATAQPSVGATVALAGYNQDRAQILMSDPACHVTAIVTAAGAPFIAHDCDATHGSSGGPLLMQQDGSWVVIGICIGGTPGTDPTNLALPATALRVPPAG